jgi:hypothetical protein
MRVKRLSPIVELKGIYLQESEEKARRAVVSLDIFKIFLDTEDIKEGRGVAMAGLKVSLSAGFTPRCSNVVGSASVVWRSSEV